MPFYNSAPTLQRSIESILNQSFTEFELILINNNSTDASIEIATKSLEDKRVRLVSEPRQGVAHAANRGLTEAKGQYIARMDADDWSFFDRLEKQVSMLDSDSTIGLVAGKVEYYGKESREGFLKYIEWSNQIVLADQIKLNQFVEYPIVNPSVMFRRDLLKENGGYLQGDFPEDYEFFLRLQQAGVVMRKVEEVVLKWSDLPNRLTRTHSSYTPEAFNRIKTKYLVKWLELNNPYLPNIWVWGAGKMSRQRSRFLSGQFVEIQGFIDVSPKEHSGEVTVINYEDLPEEPDRFIVCCVANWGAREEIKSFLHKRGWEEGVNFILAA